MANGYGSSSSSSSSSSARQSTTNTQGQVAPAGSHYMPDGSLMLDVDHARLYGNKIIKKLNLDLSDLASGGEQRNFSIEGGNNSEFILEIKNEDNHYYNFTTHVFAAQKASLEAVILGEVYNSYINFPLITDNDQYDILFYAKPGTKHARYQEKRFEDGTLDINSSKGSNSLLINKVIYQYLDVTLTIAKESLASTIENAGTNSVDTQTISLPRGRSVGKTAFSLVAVVTTATKAYKILKQPTEADLLSYFDVVVGSAPELLQGENEFPAVTARGKINTAVSNSTNVTIDGLSATPLVGDTFLVLDSTNSSSPQIVDAVSVTGAAGNVTSSVAISAANDKAIEFTSRKNYQWPVDNILNIKAGMAVVAGTNIASNSFISAYEDSVTLNEGTIGEKVIIKNSAREKNTKNQKPTLVNGVVTVQPGNIIFNQQQIIALAGDTIKVGGHGVNQIFNVTGYQVKFTDLAINLTPVSTTTSEATSAHATVAVADREGIINNVSRVGGIGINPAVKNPLITSGGGADGAGDIVMDAVQTLENGITLNIENTSTIATITGNVEILKAGTSNQTIFFDLEKLLAIS